MEEKKARILSFFQEGYSFYNMKELEKLIPKRCSGVSPMIVKELVQQMIDEDNLINVEKCGNINIYWCFKNQITQKIYDSSVQIANSTKVVCQEIEDLKEKISEARQTGWSAHVYDSEGCLRFDREKMLHKKSDIMEQIRILQIRLHKLSQTRWNDRMISEKMTKIGAQVDDIDACTDSIEVVVDYLGKKFQIETKLIKRELEIPEEFEEFDIQFCHI